MKKRKNLYDILGVKENASKEQIKKAYRTKVKKIHPDVGGDTEAFEKVQTAAMILLNPSKRQKYDETGEIDDSCLSEEEQLRIDSIQELASLFEKLISEIPPDKLSSVNVISHMRQTLVTAMKDLKKMDSDVNKNIKKFELAKDRLIFKHGKDNFLILVLTSKISAFESQRLNISRKMDVYNNSLGLLEFYDWRVDPTSFNLGSGTVTMGRGTSSFIFGKIFDINNMGS